MKSLRTPMQVAALPVRVTPAGRAEVCLVTSRSTGRWILPKGGLMNGRSTREAAAVEARGEAGLRGRMWPHPLGIYHFWRRLERDFEYTAVTVFLLRVRKQSKRWKEQAERRIGWCSLLAAADRVQEPELATLIVSLPANEAACRFLSEDGARIFVS